jgi:lipid II:glycine glycyltransferase (peptidoglycan interpeptide bridge formation enzyme)
VYINLGLWFRYTRNTLVPVYIATLEHVLTAVRVIVISIVPNITEFCIITMTNNAPAILMVMISMITFCNNDICPGCYNYNFIIVAPP